MSTVGKEVVQTVFFLISVSKQHSLANVDRGKYSWQRRPGYTCQDIYDGKWKMDDQTLVERYQVFYKW